GDGVAPRGPGRRLVVLALVGEALHARTVRVHHEDLRVAEAVGDEGDALAVGAPGGRGVDEGGGVGDLLRAGAIRVGDEDLRSLTLRLGVGDALAIRAPGRAGGGAAAVADALGLAALGEDPQGRVAAAVGGEGHRAVDGEVGEDVQTAARGDLRMGAIPVRNPHAAVAAVLPGVGDAAGGEGPGLAGVVGVDGVGHAVGQAAGRVDVAPVEEALDILGAAHVEPAGRDLQGRARLRAHRLHQRLGADVAPAAAAEGAGVEPLSGAG